MSAASAGLLSLLAPDLAELQAYAPDPAPCAIRLDANEAPARWSTEGRAKIAEALAGVDVARYPDARMVELRETIAAVSSAGPDEVLVGAGSDEVIAMLTSALSRPRGRAPAATLLTVTPTFGMYRQNARARGQRVLEVPLDDDWDIAESSMKKALELARPNVVFIASPNNPTGNLMHPGRLEAVIAAASDSLVVIDEAYIPYASRDQLDLRRHPNVAVLRTLSKVGFAAIRVGWLLAAAPLIAEIDKVRQPFNVPTASQRVAVVALRDLAAETKALCAQVRAERARLAEELDRLGYRCAPSEANFLWVKTPRPAVETGRALAARGIRVRTFPAASGRLADRMRITVGEPEDHDRLLDALRQEPAP